MSYYEQVDTRDDVTRCCDECLSYGMHESSCSMSPDQYEIFLDRIDYVCHDHQTMASKCDCLHPEDYCRKCYGKKTPSVDGMHCRMCDW